ncbi:hypothetical protein HMPREF0765_2889 [Sphingobacterium spiritivorum ATCC 33300]|uniref:Uncharacterized protein n=1 Tax=Sphingobacterium spiritivorum ATCC 33300 TaxID=525372 RepID=C2FZY3_SPHSI|nr:hypothetical protein HMPREF0765_2889 [Sphingobacterium spiritivorum ATCC 33300]
MHLHVEEWKVYNFNNNENKIEVLLTVVKGKSFIEISYIIKSKKDT